MSQDEWELSKENVQPLRQGRTMASLNAGLKPQGTDQSRIREEKHVFESELRSYTGDDPLEVWYRYIRWAEQTFPKGGKDSNLTTLLERCCRLFKDEEKYRNDERYIYSWMKMADICNAPLEIYNFMYDQNIGCELSCLYEGWASLLEQLGNSKKADAIYLEGMKKQATPLDSLRNKHEEFQKRVARKVMEGGDDSMQQDSPAEGRQVLSQLATTGKKHQAPVNRTGSSIRGNAGVIGGARPKSGQESGNKGIQIYCDENKDPSFLPPQTGEWKTGPGRRDVVNKENESKPGVWTKQKLSKPSVNVPISAVNKVNKPSFTVHVDDDQVMRTPAKMPEMSNQILSARKGSKAATTTNYLKNMTIPTTENKTEQPMYCKDKIYYGAEEYSFEELRAIRWVKKEQQKQQEAEDSRLMEECRQKLEQERQLLLDEADRVKQERLRLQQETNNLFEEARRKNMEHLQEMEMKRQSELQQHQQVVEQNIQHRLQEQLLAQNSLTQAKSQHSSRQLMFEDGSHGNTENIVPQMSAPGSRRGPSPLSCTSNLSINQSLNSSGRTPNNMSSFSHPPHSAESIDRTISGPPSPTVNTKEAMRIVMGMFNQSLELDKHSAMEEETAPEPHFVPPQPPPPTSGGMPFVIFDETKQKKASNPAPAPFTIFSDTENSGSGQAIRRCPGNALQQSRAAPVARQPQAMEESCAINVYSHPMFEDYNLEGIESHARDDITLAPVGSHLSFAAEAKFASTPFNPNNSGGGPRTSLDDTDMDMMENQSDRPPAEIAQTATQSTQQESQDQTASNSSSNSFRKNLSPIMEGSTEDSGAHSKSSNVTSLDPRPCPTLSLTPVLDYTEDSSTVGASNISTPGDDWNQSTHVIDTTTYIPPEMDEKTENLLSMSVCIVDPKDPFDKDTKDAMLNSLKKPLMHYDNYNVVDECMPTIRKGSMVSLGMEFYTIHAKIGEGGFAKVFLAESDEMDIGTSVIGDTQQSIVAIKVEEPAQKWEFYICNELQDRLAKLHDPVDVRPSMMQISNGYFFDNGSCLVTTLQPYGTLLDLSNACKAVETETTRHYLEPVMTYMAIELLHMVENMHKCHIIHGDIKPDNFLIMKFPKLPVSTDPTTVFGKVDRFVQLIDFGQSIDMTKYPSGTTFVAKVNTQCFQCIEMKTNRPWTYQTDLFGLAGTIHVLIFSQYMKVYQTGDEWKMTSSFVRNWNSNLWKKLFHTLLNVPSCDEIPDLSVIRRQFEQYFVTELVQKYNTQCSSFNNTILANKKVDFKSF